MTTCQTHGAKSYIFLSEVDQVLQVNVVPVGADVVVDEEIELVLYPVFEDKGQDSRRQFQEEDDTQEDRELKKYKNIRRHV